MNWVDSPKMVSSAAGMFENCVPLKDYKSEMTNEIKDICCASTACTSDRFRFTDTCCQISSNAASKEDVKKEVMNFAEAVASDVEGLSNDIDKVSDEVKAIKDNMNWQAICLYLTWAMIIVIGFMIYFKSFDVSVEVNNPIQNQEIILEHE